MSKLFLLLFIIFFVCCRQPSISKEKISLRDSVVKNRFAMIDSLDFYDTTNQDYKILKAYINNDTVFFANMKRQMDKQSQYIYPNDFYSCVHLQKLSDLPVDEAYRFYHDQSFCYYSQRITITRTADTIMLHYVEYGATDNAKKVEYYDQEGKKQVVPGCAIVNEFKKPLTLKDWLGLEKLVKTSDYWGLKEKGYDLCLDGSNWRIDAFTKRGKYPDNRQIHSVWRHCLGSTDFRAFGQYFLKLSGEKTMCGSLY